MEQREWNIKEKKESDTEYKQKSDMGNRKEGDN